MHRAKERSPGINMCTSIFHATAKGVFFFYLTFLCGEIKSGIFNKRREFSDDCVKLTVRRVSESAKTFSRAHTITLFRLEPPNYLHGNICRLSHICIAQVTRISCQWFIRRNVYCPHFSLKGASDRVKSHIVDVKEQM